MTMISCGLKIEISIASSCRDLLLDDREVQRFCSPRIDDYDDPVSSMCSSELLSECPLGYWLLWVFFEILFFSNGKL